MPYSEIHHCSFSQICAYDPDSGALLTTSPAGPYYLQRTDSDPWNMYKECVIDNPGMATTYYSAVTEEMDTCANYVPPRRCVYNIYTSSIFITIYM